MRKLPYLGLAVSLIGGPTGWAHDYWDLASTTDDGPVVVNELVHGASQQHDLETKARPVADQDWFFVVSFGASSYEAVVDATSGDLALSTSPGLDRLDVTGTTVIQFAEKANPGPTGNGASVALRWQNTTPGTFGAAFEWLRVRSGVCGLTCGPEDQYRLRFFDTTIAVPRFNNSSGQVTMLIVQNTTSWIRPIAGTVYFWSAGQPIGMLLGSSTFNLAANAALVLNTGTVPGVAGQAGTITISHDGGYGNLAVKAVALEPSTGFSFDSPGLYKPK